MLKVCAPFGFSRWQMEAGSRGLCLRPAVRFHPTTSVRLLLSCAPTGHSTQPRRLLPWHEAPHRRHTFPFDSLSFARQLAASGLPTEQAEAVTRYVLDAICAANDEQSATQKVAQERQREQVGGELAALRDDLKTLRQELAVQEAKFVERLNHAERLNQADRAKAVSSQRLDLNLEKGRLRDELQKHADRSVETNAALEAEIGEVRTLVEKAKNDLLRYMIGTTFTLTALGVGIARVLTFPGAMF